MANKTLQFNTCEGAGHFPEPGIEKQRRLKKNKHIVFKIIVFIHLLISEAISVTFDVSRTEYFLAGREQWFPGVSTSCEAIPQWEDSRKSLLPARFLGEFSVSFTWCVRILMMWADPGCMGRSWVGRRPEKWPCSSVSPPPASSSTASACSRVRSPRWPTASHPGWSPHSYTPSLYRLQTCRLKHDHQ